MNKEFEYKEYFKPFDNYFDNRNIKSNFISPLTSEEIQTNGK